MLPSYSTDNILPCTTRLFWIEPWSNEGDPSPLKSKEESKMYFSIVSLICVKSVFVSVFCFEVSAARSAALSHTRPAVPKPFPPQTHTPVKPHIRKSNSKNSSLFSSLTIPCSLRGDQHLSLGTAALAHNRPVAAVAVTLN